MTNNNDTNSNSNNNQDDLPTTPTQPQELAPGADQVEPLVLPEPTETPVADQRAAAEQAPAQSAEPTPFMKRKWVLITAPIVAGVLLLGIGAGAGYAAGEGGERGGHGSHSEMEQGDGEFGGHGHGRGGERGMQGGQDAEGRGGSEGSDAGPRGTEDSHSDDSKNSESKNTDSKNTDSKSADGTADSEGSADTKDSKNA